MAETITEQTVHERFAARYRRARPEKLAAGNLQRNFCLKFAAEYPAVHFTGY